MLRRISRKTSIFSKTLKFPAHYPPSAYRPISTYMCLFPKLLSCTQNHILVLKPLINNKFSDLGMPQNREFLTLVIGPRSPIANPSVSLAYSKDFVTVADEICTDVEEERELIEKAENLERFDVKKANQMSPAKYKRLRRRQVKVETEAWEAAAKEYKEFLNEMCEQKLAPNLPYMKSLFLGWFEPLTDAIAAEQGRCKGANARAGHGAYFGRLPAEMMAVITMHKLMSLMMSGESGGGVPVVHAACHIGEAIENEARIHRFLEKLRKKNMRYKKDGPEEVDTVAKEQEFLRKKVALLMKQQKLHQVRCIVKGQDDCKPWGQDARAKVGSRLIELLLEKAYIQPPVDQSAEGPPDVRPAFRHRLKENQPEIWLY